MTYPVGTRNQNAPCRYEEVTLHMPTPISILVMCRYALACLSLAAEPVKELHLHAVLLRSYDNI